MDDLAVAKRLFEDVIRFLESLGQVASQTLENIAAIDAAAIVPVLRPLIGTDKIEITDEARRLGTFETSIEPDADCCTLFVPAHPATRMTPAEAEAAESRLEIDRLVEAGVTGAVLETFEFPADRQGGPDTARIPPACSEPPRQGQGSPRSPASPI